MGVKSKPDVIKVENGQIEPQSKVLSHDLPLTFRYRGTFCLFVMLQRSNICTSWTICLHSSLSIFFLLFQSFLKEELQLK